MSAAVIEREYREIIPFILRRDRRTAKVIANDVGATPRAVENWRQGDNGPNGLNLILLARQVPELRAKVLEWLEAEQAVNDRDPAQVLLELAQQLARRGT